MMKYDLWMGYRRECIIVAGKFYPQGTGTPLLDTDPPDGGAGYPVTGRPVRVPGVVSVSRSSAGLYVVTLADKFTGLIHGDIGIGSSAAIELAGQIQSADVSGAKTVTIFTQTSGSGVDLAANAANWVSFFLLLARSPTN